MWWLAWFVCMQFLLLTVVLLSRIMDRFNVPRFSPQYGIQMLWLCLFMFGECFCILDDWSLILFVARRIVGPDSVGTVQLYRSYYLCKTIFCFESWELSTVAICGVCWDATSGGRWLSWCSVFYDGLVCFFVVGGHLCSRYAGLQWSRRWNFGFMSGLCSDVLWRFFPELCIVILDAVLMWCRFR